MTSPPPPSTAHLAGGTLGTRARRFPRAADRVGGLGRALRAQDGGLGPCPSQGTSPWLLRWDWCRSIGYGMKGFRFIHPLRGRRLVTVCNLQPDLGNCTLLLTPAGWGAGPSRKQNIVVTTTRSSRPVHCVSSSSPRWEVLLGLQRRGELLFSCPLWRCYAPPKRASSFRSDGVCAGARPTSRSAAVLDLAAADGRLRRRRLAPFERDQ
jgi:hypothetical protein